MSVTDAATSAPSFGVEIAPSSMFCVSIFVSAMFFLY
jgi:hypothetical protein